MQVFHNKFYLELVQCDIQDLFCEKCLRVKCKNRTCPGKTSGSSTQAAWDLRHYRIRFCTHKKTNSWHIPLLPYSLLLSCSPLNADCRQGGGWLYSVARISANCYQNSILERTCVGGLCGWQLHESAAHSERMSRVIRSSAVMSAGLI